MLSFSLLNLDVHRSGAGRKMFVCRTSASLLTEPAMSQGPAGEEMLISSLFKGEFQRDVGIYFAPVIIHYFLGSCFPLLHPKIWLRFREVTAECNGDGGTCTGWAMYAENIRGLQNERDSFGPSFLCAWVSCLYNGNNKSHFWKINGFNWEKQLAIPVMNTRKKAQEKESYRSVFRIRSQQWA